MGKDFPSSTWVIVCLSIDNNNWAKNLGINLGGI